MVTPALFLAYSLGLTSEAGLLLMLMEITMTKAMSMVSPWVAAKVIT